MKNHVVPKTRTLRYNRPPGPLGGQMMSNNVKCIMVFELGLARARKLPRTGVSTMLWAMPSRGAEESGCPGNEQALLQMSPRTARRTNVTCSLFELGLTRARTVS